MHQNGIYVIINQINPLGRRKAIANYFETGTKEGKNEGAKNNDLSI